MAPGHRDWMRGIRVGSAKTGEVIAFIPDPRVDSIGPSGDTVRVRGTSAAEGVAADSRGIIYGAEVGPRALKRYVRKP